MKLNLTFTPNTVPVPFNYQNYLIEIFQRWLDHDNLREELGLYSLSWLSGSRAFRRQLCFPYGAHWSIGFHEAAAKKKLIEIISAQPQGFCGMEVAEIKCQYAPVFDNWWRFDVLSPVLARDLDNPIYDKHFVFNEPQANKILTRTLQTKMYFAGFSRLQTANVTVRFDNSYLRPKTKLVRVQNSPRIASVCPVIVEGNPAAVEFAWNVGVGHETNYCFGALK